MRLPSRTHCLLLSDSLSLSSLFLGAVAGTSESSSGEMTINGYDFSKNPNEYRRLLGYSDRRTCFDPAVTVRELLFFTGEIKKIPYQKLTRSVAELLDRFGMKEKLSSSIGSLSKTELFRLKVVQARLGNPELIILDNPFSDWEAKEIETETANLHEACSENTLLVSTTQKDLSNNWGFSSVYCLKKDSLEERNLPAPINETPEPPEKEEIKDDSAL